MNSFLWRINVSQIYFRHDQAEASTKSKISGQKPSKSILPISHFMDSLSQLDDVTPSYKIATTYSGLKAIIWSETDQKQGLDGSLCCLSPLHGQWFSGPVPFNLGLFMKASMLHIGQFAIKRRRSLAKKTIYHLCDYPTGFCRGMETRLQPDGRSMK